MENIKEYINEDFRHNQVLHDETMIEISDELKQAGYSDKIVKMFKHYHSQYVSPDFLANILLDIKK